MIHPSIDLYYAMVMEVEKRHQEKLNEYLRQAAAQGQTKNKFGQKIAHGFGAKMIVWGTKLQSINTAPSPPMIIDKKLSR